jgi:ribosomal protein S9
MYVVGKRKTAFAILKEKKEGECTLNSLSIQFYPRLKEIINVYNNPLSFDITTKGGGVEAQLESAKLAIAKYIVKLNNEYKRILKEYDKNILTSDYRQKEPKKAQCHGARATRQKSYR